MKNNIYIHSGARPPQPEHGQESRFKIVLPSFLETPGHAPVTIAIKMTITTIIKMMRNILQLLIDAM